MEKPSQAIRELAERMIAAEVAVRNGSGPHESLAFCDKLRLSLTRFAGADAFAALMGRALALSRAEIPALENVRVGPEGCLEGLDLVMADGGTESGTVITANLLWLLVVFMGEPITMRLVKDAWPDLPLSEYNQGDEGIL